MLNQTLQDQRFRCLDREIKLCRGLDRGYRYCGGLYAVEFRHMLSRYRSCVGCSRTFPLMKSSVRRNSCLKRSGEMWSIVGGQLSGSTPRPVKIACQLSEKKDSSSMGAISPRARNVAILCASGCGTS